MNLIALKMLTGDRLKYISLVAGIAFAALLVTQQASIFTGYSRQTLAGISVTVDDTNDRVDVDCTNPQWSPGSAQAVTRIVFCYKPTSGSADSAIIPIFCDDFPLTTATSGTLTYDTASGGFARAA